MSSTKHHAVVACQVCKSLSSAFMTFKSGFEEEQMEGEARNSQGVGSWRRSWILVSQHRPFCSPIYGRHVPVVPHLPRTQRGKLFRENDEREGGGGVRKQLQPPPPLLTAVRGFQVQAVALRENS